jgi:hypothetical protein
VRGELSPGDSAARDIVITAVDALDMGVARVAHDRRLPAKAVTIAYATAWQESHLRNLDYGTLDLVGVFQQRPAEGGGSHLLP